MHINVLLDYLRFIEIQSNSISYYFVILIQVWPSSNLNSVQGPSGLAAPGQAAVHLWSEIMK